MTLKADLYSKLNATPAITAIIGTDNIFPERAPTSASLPYIVYDRQASQGERHMGGASALVAESFDYECMAQSSPDVEDLAEAMRNTLDGFRGLMGSTDVRSIILSDQIDRIEEFDDGSQQTAFVISMRFEIWYFRSIPTL